MLGWLHLW